MFKKNGSTSDKDLDNLLLEKKKKEINDKYAKVVDELKQVLTDNRLNVLELEQIFSTLIQYYSQLAKKEYQIYDREKIQ